MSILYGKFEMPESIQVDEASASNTFAKFIVEPFERGYGHTIGNSMRRMLLASIEAPAVVGLRIEGIPHEYMATEGVIEDITHVVLNFKGALFRRLASHDEPITRTTRLINATVDISQEDLDAANGQVAVTMAIFADNGFYEVVNPNHELFNVTKPMNKQITLRISSGRGYVPSERHMIEGRMVDEILVDAIYSPVRLVNYYVENTRVGQDTDFDKLILEVTTDGRITPAEALSFASQIAIRHFSVFDKLQRHQILFEESEATLQTDRDELLPKLCLRISDIEFSVRASNCLSGAEIEYIGELVIKPESELLKFRNFGKKSLSEIKAKLTEMGLFLGMDLLPYGINKDNVKDVIFAYEEEKAGKS